MTRPHPYLALVLCALPAPASAAPPADLDTPTFLGQERLRVADPAARRSTARALSRGAYSADASVFARVIVELAAPAPASRAAAQQALKITLLPAPGAPAFATADAPSIADAAALARRLRALPQVRRAYLDVREPRAQRTLPTDPLVSQQWHLRNTLVPDASINAPGAWDAGLTGAGVTVGIVDFGASTDHPDLAPSLNLAASQPIPPEQRDGHSTSCAGLVAAVANNAQGGAGVAFGARWSNLTFGASIADEAAAFAFRNDLNAVKSNSWGPFDNGQISYLDPLNRAALEDAATNGRAGKGTVFVWAAGNGGAIDRVDYDPYASSRFVIAVGAVGDQNQITSYDEAGSCLLGVAPSDGNQRAITTTDFTAVNTYTSVFGGSSAAAPIAAGVVALMLEANPELTYRDVQHVLIASTNWINPADPNWSMSGSARPYHERLGFGLIDAGKAVAVAAAYPGVGPEVSATTGPVSVAAPIPDGAPAGLSRTSTIADNFRVEHVELSLNVSSNFIGQLRVTLTSPSGTVATLAQPRFDPHVNYNNYVFTLTRLWDEPSAGAWTVTISDEAAGVPATWNTYTLTAFGNRRCPADITGIGGPPAPPDGQLTVDDIITFVNAFSDGSLRADVARLGAWVGPDAQLTVDDIILFFNTFSDGC